MFVWTSGDAYQNTEVCLNEHKLVLALESQLQGDPKCLQTILPVTPSEPQSQQD